MFTSNYNQSVSVGGVSISGMTAFQNTGSLGLSVPLPAAAAGALSARTSGTGGVLTLAEGHGIAQGDQFAVFWAGGMAWIATAGVVDGQSVPFTIVAASGGTSLPAQGTAVTAGKIVTIDADVDGNDITLLAMSCGARAGVLVVNNDDQDQYMLEMVANAPLVWADGACFESNPLADKTVGSVKAASAATSATSLNIGLLYTSVV